jgi:hypothetical protein
LFSQIKTILEIKFNPFRGHTMSSIQICVRQLAIAAALCATGAAHATFTLSTVATSGDSSAAALTYSASVNGARDSFSDLTINDPTPLGNAGTLNRTVLPLSYTLSTQTNLYSLQSPVIGGPAVSVENNTDSLTFSNLLIGGNAVFNFGASFYLSELTANNAVAGTMSVKATDISNYVQTFTFAQGASSNAPTLYFTLASTVALQSVELIAPVVGANPLVFATVDNVVASVPEPETYALLLAGLGTIGATVKRRKAKQA